tara:strand:- start:58 stop:222 length:165 start_codon:yes stop_codon:yes gene_type:complete
MSNEVYKDDLESSKCNDCKKHMGWYLPGCSDDYHICDDCMKLNDEYHKALEKAK